MQADDAKENALKSKQKKCQPRETGAGAETHQLPKNQHQYQLPKNQHQYQLQKYQLHHQLLKSHWWKEQNRQKHRRTNFKTMNINSWKTY